MYLIFVVQCFNLNPGSSFSTAPTSCRQWWVQFEWRKVHLFKYCTYIEIWGMFTLLDYFHLMQLYTGTSLPLFTGSIPVKKYIFSNVLILIVCDTLKDKVFLYGLREFSHFLNWKKCFKTLLGNASSHSWKQAVFSELMQCWLFRDTWLSQESQGTNIWIEYHALL